MPTQNVENTWFNTSSGVTTPTTLSNADTAAAYGAGLGLYVARAIARSHGGDVQLLDPSPEKTTFAISLPESLASGAPIEVREEPKL